MTLADYLYCALLALIIGPSGFLAVMVWSWRVRR